MVIAFAVTLPASAHIPAPQIVAAAPEIEPLALSFEPVKLYDGPTSFAILTPPETQASRPIFVSSDGRAQQHLMHARYYSAQWGGFLSVDPAWESAGVRNPQSWNRYCYVLNSPARHTDPDGRMCADVLTCTAEGFVVGNIPGAIIGAAAGGVIFTAAARSIGER